MSGVKMILSKDEFGLFRQWFNALLDLRPGILNKSDHELFEKVERAIDLAEDKYCRMKEFADDHYEQLQGRLAYLSREMDKATLSTIEPVTMPEFNMKLPKEAEEMEKQTQVATELEILGKFIEDCEAKLNVLLDKLFPVLTPGRQVEKEQEVDKDPSTPLVPMAEQIQHCREKISRIVFKISDVNERLEL